MAYDPNDPNDNPDLEMDPTSNSLFEAFTPQLQKGLLSYLQQKQAGPNLWDVAGKSLSAFSKNYMQAIADPRTRGMAWGAGLSGVGDTLRDELSPEKSLQGTLQTASVLKELAAYRTRNGKGGTSEYERLIAARDTDKYKNDPNYAKSLDARISTFEHEGQSPQEKELMQMLDKSGWTDDQKVAYTREWLKNQATKGGGTTNNFTLPAQPVYDPDTKSWVIPGSKESMTNVDKQLSEAEELLQNVTNAKSEYDPATGTYGGQARQWLRQQKEKLGGDLPPDQQAALDKYQKSDSAVGYFTSLLSNKVFGAALTGVELIRAKRWLPEPGDSPSTTQMKLNVLHGIASSAVQRLRVLRAHGYSVSDINDPKKVAAEVGSLDTYMDPKIKPIWSPPDPAAPAAPAGAVPGGPPGPPPGPGGILPGAPPPPQGGLLPPGPQGPPGAAPMPPGPVPAPMPQPAPMGPQAGPAGPPPGPPQPPPIAVQGGKLMAPKPANRAEAIAIATAAMKQGIPGDVVFRWQQENGF